ncbi:MAG: RNA polymerase sigma factor [Kofleriaceae bacterium]
MPARDLATDLGAIAAVLDGDRSAFAALVRRHNQAMFRACRAVLGNDSDAEDAVQVAWINAYRALATFRADATFRTWITRIAVNEASTRLRKRRQLAAVPVAVEDMSMEEPSSPERDAQASELGRLLEQQIDQLPEGLRTVLVLRDIIELDTAETAACLSINEENVRVRLHRARQALAHSLTSAAIDEAAVWRFDGERCARVLAHVMAAIEA